MLQYNHSHYTIILDLNSLKIVTTEKCSPYTIENSLNVHDLVLNVTETIDVLCKPGYKILNEQNSKTMRCSLSGGEFFPHWTRRKTCKEIYCSGGIEAEGFVQKDCVNRRIGDICPVECQEDYVKIGDDPVCNPDSDGNLYWDFDIICHKGFYYIIEQLFILISVDCPPLKNWANATRIDTPSKCDISKNEFLCFDINCHPGFMIDDNSLKNVKCILNKEDGVNYWTKFPSCNPSFLF